MNKNLFNYSAAVFIVVSLILGSCKKSSNNSASEISAKPEGITTLSFNHIDTISGSKSYSPTKSDSNKRIFSTPVPKFELNYKGNLAYHIVAYNNSNGDVNECSYNMLKDGVEIPFPGYNNPGNHSDYFSDRYYWDAYLPPALYTIRIRYVNGTVKDMIFRIYPQPSNPSGLVGLYRYYKASTGQHFYTSNWEELASAGAGFFFEKVQCYLYASSTSALNLSGINRYYCSGNGDHLYTNSYVSPPAGYVYEGVVGYLSTVPSGSFNLQLNRYYGSNSKDHFYCTVPETPATYGYVLESSMGYVQAP